MENVTPTNDVAKDYAARGRINTGNGIYKDQQPNGVFYDLQVWIPNDDTSVVETSINFSFKKFSGPNDNAGRRIMIYSGVRIIVDQKRRTITVGTGTLIK